MDWLTAWGVSNSIGFFFKEILLELSRDGASKYSQALFSDRTNSDLQLTNRTNLQVLTGQLIKEFLALFQQELEDTELDDEELKAYLEPIKQFIFDSKFQRILKNSLESENFALDFERLERLWLDLKLSNLPSDFQWRMISKRFARKSSSISSQSNKKSISKIGILSEIDSPIINIMSRVVSCTVSTSLFDHHISTVDYKLRQYQKLIQEHYGNLRLDSLDTSGAAYEELKLWRIFIAQNVREIRDYIPQVYEIPKEHQKMLRESGQLDDEELTLKELEEYNQFYSQQPLQSVLEVVRDIESKHLVILGDPGSGKSTLLQYIALQWAELPEHELDNTPLPLLIELRTYNRGKKEKQCQSLLEFITSESSIISCLNIEHIQDKLKTGQATILFDGLDEVFEPSQRKQVITEIIQFTQKYPKLRIIVTSRIIGYKQKTLAEVDFTHFMLQDLESTQVDDFINRWHDLTFYDRIDRERKRDRLKKAISESPAIQELSGNPLLLTMMAILNRNQELPRDRAELYNQSSRVLLHQWDTERALEDARLKPISLDYKDKQAMLRQVAYFMQANTQGLVSNSITAPDLKRILNEYLATLSSTQDINPEDIAEILIHQLRTRNFILCFLGAEYYAFVHRTFLEYFCAWEFVWQFEKARIIDIEGLKKVFCDHWHDESWHEVLRLITGMIDSKFAGEIIKFLMEQEDEFGEYGNLLMAAKCLSEVRNKTAIADITHKLLNGLENLVDPNLNDTWARRLVIEELAQSLKENSEIQDFLKSIAVSNRKKKWIRKIAIEVLSQGWTNKKETYNFIENIAIHDTDYWIRNIAIMALLENRKNNPSTFSLLRKAAVRDKHYQVQITAIEALGKYCKDKIQTFAILRRIAIFDKNHIVRITAYEMIISAIKALVIVGNNNSGISSSNNNPDFFTLLEKIATFDNDYTLRVAAIEAFAQSWNNNIDFFTLLEKIAVSDDNYMLQIATIKALAQSLNNNPDFFTWLTKFAVSDNNYTLRIAAIETLSKSRKSNQKACKIIKKIAVSENDSRIRKTAIKELTESCKNNLKDRHEVLPLLSDRAANDPDEKIRKFAKEQLEKLTNNSTN